MNRYVLIWVCLFVALVTTPAHAEIAAEDLPSIGNLAKLLGTADADEVEDNVYDAKGKISAGMIASNATRGETAAGIAEGLSGGDAVQEQALTAAFNQTRVEFENYLTTANFDVNDVGVALAASFIVLWETASNKTLVDTSALEAGKFLVHGFSAAQAEFDKISEQKKAQMRDYLMTAPVVFGSLAKAFKEQEGGEQQVAMLRTQSEEMFVKIFKMPYDFWIIKDDGSFNINAEQIQQYQEKNELSSDW